jgi:hypothetical protein
LDLHYLLSSNLSLVRGNVRGRDNFDFKSRGVLYKGSDRLEIHVCAMANTITGILALGVNDPSEDNPTATFTKDGFREDAEVQTLAE